MKNKLLLIVLSIVIINNINGQNFGNSLMFEGSQDYVVIPDNDYLDISGAYTIEAWIQSKQADTMLVLMKGWCATSDYSYYLQIRDGHIRWVWDDNGNCNITNSYFSNSAVVNHGECAHIAIVHTNTYVKLYKDGILIPGYLHNGNYSAINNSSEPLLLGAYKFLSGNYGIYYNGSIDELRYWNYERTQPEIMTGKDSPLNGNESGLVAYYDMEDTGIGNSIILTNKAAISGSLLDGIAYGSATTPHFIGSCATTVNINNYISEKDVKVYPNPTTGKITVQAEGIVGIEVMDMQGEKVKRQIYLPIGMKSNIKSKTYDIDLSQQAKGIYIVKVTTEKGVAVEKIINN